MSVIKYFSCLHYLYYIKCNTMDNGISYCDIYIYIYMNLYIQQQILYTCINACVSCLNIVVIENIIFIILCILLYIEINNINFDKIIIS